MVLMVNEYFSGTMLAEQCIASGQLYVCSLALLLHLISRADSLCLLFMVSGRLLAAAGMLLCRLLLSPELSLNFRMFMVAVKLFDC